MKIPITLAQINIQIGKPFLNLEHCIPMIQEASKRGSQLILFPELWSSGYDLTGQFQPIIRKSISFA
jgi:omega-amidase